MADIYFDNNATTPLDDRVIERMNECWKTAFANPGSQHSFGRAARRVLEDSRELIAEILDADASEVIFTSGGTESLNMAIHGFTFGRRGIIGSTAGEHPAVQQSISQAGLSGLTSVTIPVTEFGTIDDNSLQHLPWPELRLVCLLLAHNETGVVQDAHRLSQLCLEARVPLLLDAVQAVGKIPVSFRKLQATALAAASHKFHGPRGVGILLLRQGVKLAPFLVGGHQESGRRAGTESVPLIAGMTKALELWHKEQSQRTLCLQTIRDRLEQELEARCAPVVIHGRGAARLPNTLSIAFPGVSGEAMLVNLHLAGIACSLGSTCASGSAEPAPALLAMGLDPEISKSSVRFSLGCQNTPDEVDQAVLIIADIVRRLRRETGQKNSRSF
ncbi:MAG: cysteine desulfurase [Planctomycetaceae bacterium]|nr:cysteine desulfurase [Planctomycetaceae bacterium]